MSIVFVMAAIVFVVVIAVIVFMQRSGGPPEPRPALPSVSKDQRDPRELLEGLPAEVRGVLERMVDAHGVLAQAAKPGAELPVQATELITVAAPLALEVSRLEDYLDRYDFEVIASAALRDPLKRPLLQDLERMGARRDAILDALEAAALALEDAQLSGSGNRVESVLHRLRLL